MFYGPWPIIYNVKNSNTNTQYFIYYNKLQLFILACKFNVECIVELSILKATLDMYAICKALVFVKFKDISLLHDCNNHWIISFSVKVLAIPSPLVKNEQIDCVSWYNFFPIYMMSSNVIFIIHLIV
jgi:hypothetical protein